MATITYTVAEDSIGKSVLIRISQGDALVINESHKTVASKNFHYGIYRNSTSAPSPDSFLGLPDNANWTFDNQEIGYGSCSPHTGNYSVSQGYRSNSGKAKGGDLLIIVGPPSEYREAEAYVHDGTTWRKTDSYIREV